MIYTFKKKLTLHERQFLKGEYTFPNAISLACNETYNCNLVTPGPFDFDRSVYISCHNKETNITTSCPIKENIVGEYTVENGNDVINLTLS